MGDSIKKVELQFNFNVLSSHVFFFTLLLYVVKLERSFFVFKGDDEIHSTLSLILKGELNDRELTRLFLNGKNVSVHSIAFVTTSGNHCTKTNTIVLYFSSI